MCAWFAQYFESVRVLYAEEVMGVPVKPEDLAIIMGSTSCRYKAPVAYPDTVVVGCRTEITDAEKGEFIQHYAVASEKTGRVVAEGDAGMIVYDYVNERRIAVPEEMSARVAAFEEGGGGAGAGRE